MYHVMLVDDREVFRRGIKRLPYWSANEDRFAVLYEAENGLEALNFLKMHSIDVVITDIQMPLCDGIELLKQIHHDNLCRCVILLSEYADFEYAKQGILNGAFDYIVKPIDNAKLTDTMERAYGFLSATQPAGASELRGLYSLVNAIVSGNQERMLSCARRMWENICSTSGTDAESIMLGSDAMKSIAEELEQVLSYLSDYIRFDEYIWLDANKENCFVSRISELMAAVRPYLNLSANAMIAEICRRALYDPGKAPGLQQLAEEYHMNVKYLGELFKKETGQGYVQYILMLRMTQAAVRLIHTDDRVYEIAYDLGYNDFDYFSKSFKKVMGMSPKLYREVKKHG